MLDDIDASAKIMNAAARFQSLRTGVSGSRRFPAHFHFVRALALAIGFLTVTVCFELIGAEEVAPVPPPVFSVPGGVFRRPIEVELRAPTTASPGTMIRYTLDGSDPTEGSAPYESPLKITDSAYLRARVFVSGRGSSRVVAQSFTFLAADFQRFDSTLPQIVINTFGQPISHQTKVQGSFRIVEPVGGAASVENVATWEGRMEINHRGNTSRQFPKHSYTLKLVDEQGRASKAPLAGFPEDSDWVLYAPYFDRTLLRDVLAYDLSNQIGRYAPRTRFVEVFVAGSKGRVSGRDYAGVYVLEEKIKSGKHRVDLGDGATDGYLFKMDHVDPGEQGFRTERGRHFLYVQPKERDITRSQKAWLIDYMNEFEQTLHGTKFADADEGYGKFLDVDAFIDHFWLVEMSKNVDGFRFSAFLHLIPGGKLKMGPIWDWDQSFGNANFYDGDNPEGWYWPYIRGREIDWFARLSKDPEFRGRYVKRWIELRRGAFATSRILEQIDALVASLGEARQRNSHRWPTRRDYTNYIDQMKQWIRHRVEWIDQKL